uniref:thioredoxin-dependent peroxiredoxin n=1 Tax=Aotus nancymaae TaxID=37293 RepID=A0A2K5FA93_AOTNA
MSSGNAKIGHPALNFKATATDEGISFRGLFVIDDKGILRLVQAFQFIDKHGEVCPAGWKPGSDAIKPDVQNSKEYFSKQK